VLTRIIENNLKNLKGQKPKGRSPPTSPKVESSAQGHIHMATLLHPTTLHS